MLLKLMLFSLIFISALAQNEAERVLSGYDPVTDVIAAEYEAGPFLIYDCQRQSWVCVLEEYFKLCDEKRAADILERKETYRCAPIGDYPTKKSCFQKQLFMVSQNYGNRFCLSEYIRPRNVKY